MKVRSIPLFGFYLLMAIGFLMTGCCNTSQKDCFGRCCPGNQYNDPVLDGLSFGITEIINTYEFDTIDKYRLRLCNAYVTRDDSKGYITWNLWTDWETPDLLDIKEGRKLLVRAYEGLLERVNESPEIAALLGTDPFPIENVYISIELISFYGKYVDPLYLARMEVVNGQWSEFYAHTAYEQEKKLFHVHQEPYCISKTIVATQERVEKQRRIKEDEFDPFIDLYPSTFTNYTPEEFPSTNIGAPIGSDY